MEGTITGLGTQRNRCVAELPRRIQGGCVSIEEQILALGDEQAIRELIRGAWAAIDRKEWDVYADAFAEDGTFEIWGQRRRGREAIADGPARDLTKFDRLQHIITNEIVRVTGDDAEGQWYAIAVHVPEASRPRDATPTSVFATASAPIGARRAGASARSCSSRSGRRGSDSRSTTAGRGVTRTRRRWTTFRSTRPSAESRAGC